MFPVPTVRKRGTLEGLAAIGMCDHSFDFLFPRVAVATKWSTLSQAYPRAKGGLEG